MKDIRQHIFDRVSDLVCRFMYYGRKEDEDVPVGAIEDALASGIITKAEIVEKFKEELDK